MNYLYYFECKVLLNNIIGGYLFVYYAVIPVSLIKRNNEIKWITTKFSTENIQIKALKFIQTSKCVNMPSPYNIMQIVFNM